MIKFRTDGTANIGRPVTVGTHNATFHADEVFATAIMLQSLGELHVTRTRDQVLLDQQEALLDVGGVYDEATSRYDHHQKGGAGFNPENRHERQETWSENNPEGRWRRYGYDELSKRDKTNLDIFWLKDKTLEDSENLPEPGVLAAEIADDLQAAYAQFAAIAEQLTQPSQVSTSENS